MNCTDIRNRVKLLHDIGNKIEILHDIIEESKVSKDELLAMTLGLSRLSKYHTYKLEIMIGECNEEKYLP